MKNALLSVALFVSTYYGAFAQGYFMKYFGDSLHNIAPTNLKSTADGEYLMSLYGGWYDTTGLIYLDYYPYPSAYSFALHNNLGDTIWSKNGSNGSMFLENEEGLFTFINNSNSIYQCDGIAASIPIGYQAQITNFNREADFSPLTFYNEDCNFNIRASINLQDGNKLIVYDKSRPIYIDDDLGGIAKIGPGNNIVVNHDYDDIQFFNAKICKRDNCSSMLAYNEEDYLFMSTVSENALIVDTKMYPYTVPIRLLRLSEGGFMLLAKESNIPCIMKFDSDANLLWKKYFIDPPAIDIIEKPDSNIALLYNLDTHHIGSYLLDTAGNIINNSIYTLPDTAAVGYYITNNEFQGVSIAGRVGLVNSTNTLVSPTMAFLLIDSIPFTSNAPDLVNTTVATHIYEDANQNCSYDPGEDLYPGWRIDFENSNGQFSVFTSEETIPAPSIAQGDYILNLVPPSGIWEYCYDGSPFNINNQSDIYFGVHDLCQPVYLSIDTVICQNQYYISFNNHYFYEGTTVDTIQHANSCDTIITVQVTKLPLIITNYSFTLCPGESVTFQGTTYSEPDTIVQHYPVAGYCDSTVILRIAYQKSGIIKNYSICPGDTILVGSSVYSVIGNYIDTLVSSSGCDSVVYSNIFNNFKYKNYYYYICPGDSLVTNNAVYTMPGNYRDTIYSDITCDSIKVYHISWSNKYTTRYDTICPGQSISVGNSTYTLPGIYKDTFSIISGCDSIITTELTIRDINTFNYYKICPGQVYHVGNSVYSEPGTYIDHLTSYFGCDSTVTTSIHFNTVYAVINVPLCPSESYTYKGSIYTAPAIICDTLASCFGCDSIILITLTNNQILTYQNRNICPGMTVEVGNSIYTSEGIYYDTLTAYDGCDSIVRTVINFNDVTKNVYIKLCPGQSYQVGSSVYTQPGNYTDVLTTYFGCDSIIHTYISNILLTSFTIKICPGEMLTLFGNTVTQPGTYRDTLISYFGCDSIVAFTVSWNNKTKFLYPYICPGDSVHVGNSVYTLPGYYRDTLTTYLGCDSIVISNVQWNTKTKNITGLLCPGETFTVAGNLYTQPGNYVDTLTSYLGCDSILYISLNWRNISTFINREICLGSNVMVAGQTYSIAGNYSDTLTSYMGCDSILYIHICYSNFMEHDQSVTICAGESLVVGNTIHTQSGYYSDTLTTASGCDSIVRTTLIVLPNIMKIIDTTICQGLPYSLGTHTYYESGIYADTLSGNVGCDTIITLHLSVLPVEQAALSGEICPGDTLWINDIAYVSSGEYMQTLSSALGCDSILDIVITELPTDASTLEISINQGMIIMGNAIYSDTSFVLHYENQFGCDSTVTYYVDVLTAIKDPFQESSRIQVVPNPNRGIFHLETLLPESTMVSLSLYNSLGEIVQPLQKVAINAGLQYLSFTISNPVAGMYLIMIKDEDGRIYIEKLVVID